MILYLPDLMGWLRTRAPLQSTLNPKFNNLATFRLTVFTDICDLVENCQSHFFLRIFSFSKYRASEQFAQ